MVSSRNVSQYIKLVKKRIFKIPIRCIDKLYGKSNLDNAVDDILAFAAEREAYPSQFSLSFEVDNSHANPWYHSLTCIGFLGDDECFENFLQEITHLKLEVISVND